MQDIPESCQSFTIQLIIILASNDFKFWLYKRHIVHIVIQSDFKMVNKLADVSNCINIVTMSLKSQFPLKMKLEAFLYVIYKHLSIQEMLLTILFFTEF